MTYNLNTLQHPDVEAAKKVARETGYDCAIAVTSNAEDRVLLVKLAKNNVRRFKGATWDEAAENAIAELGRNTVEVKDGVMTITKERAGHKTTERRPFNRKMRRAMNAAARRNR